MSEIVVVDQLDDLTREAVLRLADEAGRRLGHPALADNKLVELRTRSTSSGFSVLGLGGDEADDAEGGDRPLLGAALAVRPGGPRSRVSSVQAVTGDRAPGDLRDALVGRAVDEARRRGSHRVQWWAVQADRADDALAADLGLSRWRDLLNMRRPLPHPEGPDLPPHVELRGFRPGHDEDAWVEVNRRAFAGHPEQGAVTRDDLEALMHEPWFHPDDFLLAEDAGGLAGFCWVKVPDDEHGEIYVIGVDPDRQGLGLGRGLTLAGLRRMVERGLGTATLYVDGGNEAAVALYHSLGFSVDHVDRAYAGDHEQAGQGPHREGPG